jgi:hypothetical protein
MKDRFDEGVVLEPFAVIFDEAGKPVGITDGKGLTAMGDVELTMVAEGDSFKLSQVHVRQEARLICCPRPPFCKTN